MFKNLQMLNKELQAETKDDSEQMPIVASPAKMPQNPLLAVRCIHSHEDGLTNGKVYDAHKSSDWGFDIFPDDYGSLSGWDKRYFEVVGNDG